MSSPSPARLYRSLLSHLRRLPDPHLWSTLVPHFKTRLRSLRLLALDDGSVGGSTTSAQGIKGGRAEGSMDKGWREEKRFKILRRARKDMDQVRMAIACHPHALTRLLEKAYGVRGRVRWELIKNVTLTSSATGTERYPPARLQPLPACLFPLAPAPIPPDPIKRARTEPQPTAVRKAAYRAWKRQWDGVKVPLIVHPPVDPRNLGERSVSGSERWPATGWEGNGVVESLQQLAGFNDPLIPSLPRRARPQYPDIDTPTYPSRQLGTSLPTFAHLSPSLRRIFPRRRYPVSLPFSSQPSSSMSSFEPNPLAAAAATTYPRPPPRSVRQNPHVWTDARALTPRAIRRAYARIWDKLVWVRWVSKVSSGKGEEGGRWEKCTYEQMVGRPSRGPRVSPASAEEMRWILGELDEEIS